MYKRQELAVLTAVVTGAVKVLTGVVTAVVTGAVKELTGVVTAVVTGAVKELTGVVTAVVTGAVKVVFPDDGKSVKDNMLICFSNLS